MAMFTRTITKFRATAIGIDWEGNNPIAKVLGSCEFFASNATKTDARKALKSAGVEVKRGTEVRIEEIEKVTYGMDIEQFMQLAQPIASEKVEQL